MERERLKRLVGSPSAVAAGDLTELKALAERFPWFAGAQMLSAIGEHRSSDVLSDEYLTQAAAHIPSRSVLYDRVGKAPDPPSIATEPSGIHLPEPATEATSSPVPGTTQEPPRTIVPEVGPLAALSTDGPDPLEQQYIGSILTSAYDPGRASAVPGPEEQGSKEPDHTVPLGSPHTSAESPFSKGPDPIPATRPRLSKDARLRFTDWLAEDVSACVPSTSTPLPTGKAVPTIVPRSLPPQAPLAEVVDTRDLIDRFISQQSPAPPVKTAFYTPQQAAKRSLDDSTGLVTETLAKIYAMQGDIPKAIDAYHRLALKYPEKSAYFAALSKELEGQLNK
ncbi:MAG: hypothetical protein KDC00_02840 [Flavobacteriales bacterium]|nr:hypothetical protein [Flavobacteriales bacterium]